MSAQQSSPAAQPPADRGDGTDGSEFSGDGTHQPIEGAVGETNVPLATAELANLLANGQWGITEHGLSPEGADANAYDGHVALALDVLPDIDSTLDLLTSSHHLFDVPALDVPSSPDDISSA